MNLGRHARRAAYVGVITLSCFGIGSAGIQSQGPPPQPTPQGVPQRPPIPPPSAQGPPQKPVVEKLGEKLFRIGTIRVDTDKRELAVVGRVNAVYGPLEFVANTRGGMKAYESAIELDTNGITFHTACLLIGLDAGHSVRPTAHFDPRPPEGDAVDVLVSWQENGRERQINAEQLLYDRERKASITNSRWVFTGSALVGGGMLLADAEGALIGFVHTPAPVIENVSSDAVKRYGAIILNQELGLKPGTPITLTVRAIPQGKH